MKIYMACPITAINKQIMWTKLTWFALFSQRFVLHRLCTAHNHLACMNSILHHHGFLGVKFGFSGETFKETFAVKPLTVWTASPFTLSSITSTQGTVTKTNNVRFSTTTTTTVLQPFFRDHPGEPVPEENFWTLWCQGRLTEADTSTIRMGTTPSGLTSAHLHHPPYFLQAGCLSCCPTNSIKASKATSAFGLGRRC